MLLRFINGYQGLKKEDMERMFAELNDYYSKSPFKNKQDPFDILNRRKLIKSRDASIGIKESELTPLGLKVVTLMVKNKISLCVIVVKKSMLPIPSDCIVGLPPD